MQGTIIDTLHCGRAIVTKYLNHKHIEITFSSTGFTRITSLRVIKKDRPRLRDPLARTVFTVGFTGIGEYKTHTRGVEMLAYRRWRAMLRRCYYEARECYIGVTVCDAWQDYQVYAQWFGENYPADGRAYEVDKDLAIPSNKVYRPEACQFVTKQENLAGRKLKKY